MVEMRDRTQSILEASVREFIKTGKPITSEILYDVYDFGIKPAMIRLELGDLSSDGFFYQTHPSGGRYPTDKAYKYFVDSIIEKKSKKEHRWIDEEKIEDDFKGFIDDARSFLLGLDIFCMPSRSEAMPYALLEAGFAGLPIIATAVGGIPELIENGISGVLIPTENTEILLSSLILLKDNPDLRKRLGTNLKASIQEDFLFEKMAEKTFQLYL